jgi:AraC-like DNA-binding protein
VFAELKRAGALQRLLRRTKLPSDQIERLDEFAPAHVVLHFMAESAGYLDSLDLAFRAATRAQPQQLGHWGHAVQRCYTLRSALKHLCVLYPLEAPFVQFGLVEGKTQAWLWRRRSLTPKNPAGEMQGEQFTMGSMIQVVRMAAGSQWSPPAVRIESPKSEWALRTEGLAQSRVDFGGPVLAIAMPNDLLDRRLPRPPSGRAATEEAGAPAANDLVGSLVQALSSLDTKAPLSLDLGAEIADTTPRTLQRWLAEESTGWRQLVDRVRFETCERLLSDPSLTLTEISMKLGYSDHAHFTRAFHRWTGEAPSIRRRRRMNHS